MNIGRVTEMKSRGTLPTPDDFRAAERIVGEQAYRVPVTNLPIRLRLDRNEGRPPHLSPDDLAKLDSELFRRYPQVNALEELLAERLRVDRGQVLVTAGGDDALLRICLAFLEPGREFILPVPTFEMLAKYCRLAGGKQIPIPWTDGEYPAQAVLNAVNEKTAAIAIVSPNNPTGAVISAADFSRLATEAPQTLLLVDLAYAEFAAEDLTELALRTPNAIVVRTFSKAWGLAGLRVGYAVGPPRWIDWLRRAGNPYAVSGFSAACARMVLMNESKLLKPYVAQVQRERDALYEFLTATGLDAVPSQGNFVFARTPSAEAVWRSLAEQGIGVRWFGEQSDLRDALRITCPGTPGEFEILMNGLAQAFTPT